tara:strand:+ start:35 stop:421 length:387 start_codon:yes stop_codon:yes gene_type:complete
MTDLVLILKHHIPLHSSIAQSFFFSFFSSVHFFYRKTQMAKIPDDEIEMFLDDLTEDDWVFMVRQDGSLKSMMIPKLKVGDEIDGKIISIFSVLDEDLIDTIMDVTEPMDDNLNLDQRIRNKIKKTLH